MRLVALGFGMLIVSWSRLKTFQAQLNASASDANIGVMILEYVLKKEHVVIEDDVHAILDLKKAGEVEWYTSPEYDLVAWNKEESCVFGLLKQTGETYNLSFNVANHGEYDLELDKVLKVCNERFEAMLDW